MITGALVLFLIMGYQLSFSDTFLLNDEIDAKEQKLEWLKQQEKQLPVMKAKLSQFEKAYSRQDSLAIRDELTAYISGFSEKNNCLVTEIPSSSTFKEKSLQVKTNTFTIRGNFQNLLKLLHSLENEFNYVAKIMSARFYTIKDYQSKKKQLYLTLVTQSFEQHQIQ